MVVQPKMSIPEAVDTSMLAATASTPPTLAPMSGASQARNRALVTPARAAPCTALTPQGNACCAQSTAATSAIPKDA